MAGRAWGAVVLVALLATCADAGPEPLDEGAVVLATTDVTGTFDRRLLGTNVPAWLGHDFVTDPVVLARTRALGPTLVRMPGGSWSNHYDWSACERGEPCPWADVLRPRDFAAILAATGAEGMWTVNVNGTAQEAAALVAYFNGEVDDPRPLGTDRDGEDWGTVGEWAQRRRDGGHAAPVPVRYWEIGNEIYAGRGGEDDECADFAWEDVWTCDGQEYLEGDGAHDGFLAFRNTMQAVDPSILVGAVGVEDPGEWGGWGDDVLAAADDVDFYVIHDYAFFGRPDASAALERPQAAWPEIMATVTDGARPDPPVAVTEYNLVATQDEDEEALMTRAVNALYVADTIGQMATSGVAIANHWNLANGRAENGTDYGLLDADTGRRAPQYYGAALWRDFGDELIAVRSDFDPATTLSVYAARTAAGALTVLAVNKTGGPVDVTMALEGAPGRFEVRADVLTAAALDATEVELNGTTDPSDDLEEPAATRSGVVEGHARHTFPPWSVTLLRFEPVKDR